MPGIPVRVRRAARLVVLDRGGRVLLLPAHDPLDPRAPGWWEVPGGGIEPGETPIRAALREAQEETGVVVPPGCVGAQAWRVRATYRYRGRRRLVEETVLLARLSDPPVVVAPARLPHEIDTFAEPVWLTPAELARVRTYPDGLALLLPSLRAGRSLRTRRQHWS